MQRERQRWWRWVLYIGAWTVIGLLSAGPMLAQYFSDGTGVPWQSVASPLLGWYLWGLLFPFIWWLTQHFPFDRRYLLSRIPINLAAALLITLVYVVLFLAKDEMLLRTAQTEPNLEPVLVSAIKQLPEHLASGSEYHLLVYFAILAASHAYSYYSKYRVRELKTSKLEAQLALARLEVLKMQLHPHFLFNTLNAISSLMHRDVEAADRMITLLSDLLRLSLDQDDRHQVTLQEELSFLDRYLAIEKIRFRDRLVVDTDIDQRCLQAFVPRLILQPLVENAIRHGIAMRSAAGQLAIRARLQGTTLQLEVADDGPGIGNTPIEREGVGLANTRARLAQIYGKQQSFSIADGSLGGVEAAIQIPFELKPRLELQSVG